ncbi:MAG: hypothetical protein V3S32_08680 [Acidimicrobiia bacterium]
MSWALFGIAITLSYLGRHEEALEAAGEAMELLAELTKNFNWGPVVSSIHRRRGNLVQP